MQYLLVQSETVKRQDWIRRLLKVGAAAALLGVPIVESHREISFGSQRTDGSLIAIQAAHPGDAVHIEASAVEVGAFCAACELALQQAEEYSPAWVFAPHPDEPRAPTPKPTPVGESHLRSALVRGPPSSAV